MKKTLLLAIALTSLSVSAKVPDPFLSITCREDIERVLKKFGSKDKWVRSVDPEANVLSFKSPTKQFGRWVEVQSFANPYVFIFDGQQSRVYQWEAKTCKLLNDTTHKPLSVVSGKSGMDDAEVQALTKGEKPSLIYVWSPSMVYSMSEMKVFRQVAKDLGLEFVPLLDSKVQADLGKKLISGYEPDLKIQKTKSMELYMRDGNIHFPASFVAGNGRISNRIFGVMTAEELKEAILDELAFIGRVDK